MIFHPWARWDGGLTDSQDCLLLRTWWFLTLRILPSLRQERRHLLGAQSREAYFLDRLLVGSIVEARGCERFRMIAEALEPEALADFYREIARTESQHQVLFYRLAETYFDPAEVRHRYDELLDREAEILQSIPIRPVVH